MLRLNFSPGLAILYWGAGIHNVFEVWMGEMVIDPPLECIGAASGSDAAQKSLPQKIYFCNSRKLL